MARIPDSSGLRGYYCRRETPIIMTCIRCRQMRLEPLGGSLDGEEADVGAYHLEGAARADEFEVVDHKC